MENIFEGAKFGDKFITRDGRVGMFLLHYQEDDNSIEYPVHLILQGNLEQTTYTTEGIPYIKSIFPWENKDDVIQKYSIISRYQESVDENELDELAIKYSDKDIDDFQTDEYWSHCADDIVCSARREGTWKAFMAGYRSALNNKAMEE